MAPPGSTPLENRGKGPQIKAKPPILHGRVPRVFQGPKCKAAPKFRTGEATAAEAGRNRVPTAPSRATRHPPRIRGRCFAGWGRGCAFSALQPLIANRAQMLVDAKHDQDELRNDARKHDSDEHPGDA